MSVKTMTRRAYLAKPADFRATIDGRPYVLSDEGARGTCLVPVDFIDEPAEVFRVVCAWCDRVMIEGSAGARVSHGLCPDCEKKM